MCEALVTRNCSLLAIRRTAIDALSCEPCTVMLTYWLPVLNRLAALVHGGLSVGMQDNRMQQRQSHWSMSMLCIQHQHGLSHVPHKHLLTVVRDTVCTGNMGNHCRRHANTSQHPPVQCSAVQCSAMYCTTTVVTPFPAHKQSRADIAFSGGWSLLTSNAPLAAQSQYHLPAGVDGFTPPRLGAYASRHKLRIHDVRSVQPAR